MSDTIFTYFATAPRGMEQALADELAEFNAQEMVQQPGGVSFQGALEVGYRTCLWSRIAGRIFLQLGSWQITEPQQLYEAAKSISWTDQFGVDATFSVEFVGGKTPEWVRDTRYPALLVKDAIADSFRDQFGSRPNVDPQQADVRFLVFIHEQMATISLNMAGDALHRRGYRGRHSAGPAPVKESLAAALLRSAGWTTDASVHGTVVDLMCGSGTLILEAALIAADVAPGLVRSGFGFLSWRGHQREIWQHLLQQAQQRDRRAERPNAQLMGYDESPVAIRHAQQHCQALQLDRWCRFTRQSLESAQPPDVVWADESAKKLVVVNPPYGERLGDEVTLTVLYRQLGNVLKRRFGTWDAYVLSGNRTLTKCIGLKSAHRFTVQNGPLDCQWLHFPLQTPLGASVALQSTSGDLQLIPPGSPAEMFANRLRKNLRRLQPWAQRNNITCYRVYDADIPEYAVAIDCYGAHWLVQEYAPPATVDTLKAEQRRRDIIAVVMEVGQAGSGQLHYRLRKKQRGISQYEKIAARALLTPVPEGGCTFLVNFDDYLDTGLFLDHRLTRQLIGSLASGRSFLNLFCYTASATIYAIKGGATSSTSVDMSATYLDWAAENFSANHVRGRQHELVRADCIAWLQNEVRSGAKKKYDLIFVDPPTFSNSKKMAGTFDVQRDYPSLLKMALSLLTSGGTLIFSTNFQRFSFDPALFSGYRCVDWTKKTLPEDFSKHGKIHQVWRIEKERLSKN